MTYKEMLEEKERLAKERHDRVEAMYGKPKKAPKATRPAKVKPGPVAVTERPEADPSMNPSLWFWTLFNPSETQQGMKFEANQKTPNGMAVDFYSPRFKVAIDLYTTDTPEERQSGKDKKKALQMHGIALLRVKALDAASYEEFLKRVGFEHRKRKHYEYRTMKKKVEHHVPRSLRDIKYPDKRVDTNPVRNQERDRLFAGVVNEIDLKKKLPF